MSHSHRTTTNQRGFVPNPHYSSAKAVGSFVPKLAAKAFERYGFGTAAILTDWRSVVGPELAACTAPERLRWPKMAEELADASSRPQSKRASSHRPTSKPAGAVLTLRVTPAKALDVQYRLAQIVERINVHFGYRAVTEIRLVQAPMPVAVPPATPRRVLADKLARSAAAPSLAAQPAMDGIADAPLRAALERLSRSIAAVGATAGRG